LQVALQEATRASNAVLVGFQAPVKFESKTDSPPGAVLDRIPGDEELADGSPVARVAPGFMSPVSSTEAEVAKALARVDITSPGSDTPITPVKLAFDAKAENERKKAEIRAKLAAGVLDDDGDVCLNCGS
jgi:hypothetical protein